MTPLELGISQIHMFWNWVCLEAQQNPHQFNNGWDDGFRLVYNKSNVIGGPM